MASSWDTATNTDMAAKNEEETESTGSILGSGMGVGNQASPSPILFTAKTMLLMVLLLDLNIVS